jgi:multisubunit Na+/H+ antiporter MnhB subunit
MKFVLPLALSVIIFGLLYSIYKKRKYILVKQISATIMGTIVLVYILYACNNDN